MSILPSGPVFCYNNTFSPAPRIAHLLMLSLSQVLAIVIFGLVLAVIISDRFPRYIPALVGGALMIFVVFLGVQRSPEAVWNVLNLAQLGQGAFWVPGQEHIEIYGGNWQGIIFLGGW